MSGSVDTESPPSWGTSLQGFLLSRHFVTFWSVVFAVFFFGFATKGTFDPATIGAYFPGHFFSAQADALLQGRLWVEKSNLPGECYFRDGNCYGYYGLPPSLVRIPLVLVLGVQDSELTTVFLAVAAGIAVWAALDLCRRVLSREDSIGDRAAAGFMAVAAIVLGPGSALMLASDAYVYQEAILWSVAGLMVGIDLFWRWWVERRDRQFVGAVIALTIAAASRPSTAFVGMALALGLVVARAIRRRIGWRMLAGAAVLAVVPVVAVIGVFALKFGTFTPPYDSYEGLNFRFIQYNMSNNDGKFGSSAKFIPTSTLAYLRPDTLQIETEWPFIRYKFGRPYGQDPLERITYVPPAKRDSMNVEPTVSITNVMPLPLAATIAAAVAIFRRRRQRHELLILAALVTPLVLMATIQSIASRYLADFYPLLAAGTAFSATLLPRFRRAGWNSRAVVTLGVAALTAISIPIVLALAAQYNWTYRFGIL
ncbi:MAG: hypothetical protein FGM58_05940 [Acidimicrobiia bacterium]|nr:hypothetical protein [Acidimicrobiia bacterium]